MHLAEISSQVAILMLDQAGWHMSGALTIPTNITLLPLPPKCPEAFQRSKIPDANA